MATPTIRYARTSDGVRIAYASVGRGRPMLCMPPFPFSHIEAGWQLDGQRRWYERLARRLEVVLYDARGKGLSDRARTEFDLEAMTADLDAVRERAGLERFALCAMFNAAPVAIAYAARHPERVRELVLWGAFARGGDVYPVAIPEGAAALVGRYWPMLVDTAARMWADAPGSEADEIARYFEACVEPVTALRAFSHASRYDVDALVPRVTSRTLVLQRAHARAQRADVGPALAARMPAAELVLLDGDTASPFSGDVDAGVAAIERFLGIDADAGTDAGAGGSRSADAPAASGGGDVASPDLTPREREILRLLARGHANKQLAAELGISVHTVERHLTNLYAKLACRGRTEAVAFALTHGYA